LVMATKIVDLARQIILNGALDAGIQKLGCLCAVEIAGRSSRRLLDSVPLLSLMNITRFSASRSGISTASMMRRIACRHYRFSLSPQHLAFHLHEVEQHSVMVMHMSPWREDDWSKKISQTSPVR
jgi:hypothetical protein